MSFAGLLNATASIRRASRVADGQGGAIVTEVEVAASAARIRPASGREAIRGQRPEGQVTHVLYLPVAVDVRPRDRVEIAGRPYEVFDVRRPSPGSHLEVDCLERQAGR